MNLIITATDKKYWDFLINHWLKSLQDNNKFEYKILILDYWLDENQKNKLIQQGCIIEKCERKWHVVNIRYIDAKRFLEWKNYDQIMICDSWDIIFQADISKIFEIEKNKFKAVCEQISPPMLEMTILWNYFEKQYWEKVYKIISWKKMINWGVLVASQDLFIKLCEEIEKNVVKLDKFWPDQIILNYFLYKNWFFEIDRTYNFIPTTVKEKFSIKNWVFYDKNWEKIRIVHNAWSKAILRTIKNFWYWKNFNNANLYLLNFLKVWIIVIWAASLLIRKIKIK